MRERLVGVSSLRGPRQGPCQASFLELGETHVEVTNHIPNRGDQVEQRRMGISRVGVVWYADQLQVLVKWQDGKSSSLRLGRDQFSIRTADAEDARSLNETPRNASTRSASNDRKPVGRAYRSKNSLSAHSGQ
jgi:hypothetical protein